MATDSLPYILLPVSCVFFDEASKISWATEEDYVKACVDCSGHGFIAFLSWLATVGVSRRNVLESVCCGLLASFVDIDHFLAAKSYRLKVALSLSSRPWLHSTSILVPVVPSLFLISYCCTWLTTLPLLITVSILSHHLRDGVRRGLWFWPLGSTPAVPYWLYLLLIVFLPILTSFIKRHTSQQSVIVQNNGIDI